MLNEDKMCKVPEIMFSETRFFTRARLLHQKNDMEKLINIRARF